MHNHPDSLTLQRVTVNGRGGGTNPNLMLGVGFLGEINTPSLINRASQVCMMTEIRRGEEYQVVL